MDDHRIAKSIESLRKPIWMLTGFVAIGTFFNQYLGAMESVTQNTMVVVQIVIAGYTLIYMKQIADLQGEQNERAIKAQKDPVRIGILEKKNEALRLVHEAASELFHSYGLMSDAISMAEFEFETESLSGTEKRKVASRIRINCMEPLHRAHSLHYKIADFVYLFTGDQKKEIKGLNLIFSEAIGCEDEMTLEQSSLYSTDFMQWLNTYKKILGNKLGDWSIKEDKEDKEVSGWTAVFRYLNNKIEEHQREISSLQLDFQPKETNTTTQSKTKD